ncbi:WD40 repeat-like protein [Hypoxylon sp. NC1633]|nr:WD40 repeat-like protein [Hypoxylon sp. NC1633]
MAAADAPRQYVPLTCHGHSRPVPHISFSPLEKDGSYYLLSACKDGNPMLRDGQTGDWIGTFIGHKGAVWQARLSPDAATAATASADFTAKIWDTHTGELLFTLQHDHIVRAVVYSPDNSDLVATGGMEKKLRIFDLTEMRPKPTSDAAANGSSNADAAVAPSTIPASLAFEIGAGIHTASIKFIVWTKDPRILITASDNTLRWFDVPTKSVVKMEVLDGEIGSCEFCALAPEHTAKTDIGGGYPVLAVAAGKSIYFWGGLCAMDELKSIKMGYKVASVALDPKGRKIVVGEDIPATWARVYRWDDDVEIDIHKGHHGPVWSVAFSPDGKLYATGSEDGTIKMWKNCDGFYGLWRGGGGGVAERGAE